MTRQSSAHDGAVRCRRSRIRAIAGAAAILAGLFVSTGASAEWPTRGGDDGRVIEVTSLADGGEGSFRAALAASGKRRIVFKVGGEIWLKSPLAIRKPQVTIAGETAPSPGISLMGDKLVIRTHDVILRHIRVRVGERPGSDPSNRDGISVDHLRKEANVRDVLVDHCSVAWALDEGIQIWGGVKNVRVRRTIVAETLNESIHEKGAHSMGLLVGRGGRNVLIERNLLAHNMFRNPVVDGGAHAVVINNLIYDPGMAGLHVYRKDTAGPTLVSAVGNLLIPGPSSRSVFGSFDQGLTPGSAVYYHDNRAIGVKAFSPKEPAGRKGKERPAPFVEEPPIWFDWLEPLPVEAVEAAVLADVGARPWDRDDTDRRILAEVAERTGSIRDMPADERLRLPRPLDRKGAEGQ